MGILAHRSIQELDLAPITFECCEEEDVMPIVPGQAIRARAEEPLHGPRRDTIAPTIQTRASQLGTAGAVIAAHVFVH
jgi:hypothetical protein